MLGFALAAGMLAAVNPCGFAMLPAYLTLVVKDSVARALAATALMAAGFLLVFGVFGLIVAPLGTAIQEYLPAATVLIGLVMAALGAWMLTGRQVTLPKPAKGAPTNGLGSMFGYGLAYAIVSLSCTIGPFLAVTAATFNTGSIMDGVAAYLAYAAGMALVVAVLAVSAALSATTRIRRILPYVNRTGGAILLLAGAYLAYYGIYELRLFHAGASVEDPIIDAAAAVQTEIAAWIDATGPIPILIATAALVTAGVLVTKRRARS